MSVIGEALRRAEREEVVADYPPLPRCTSASTASPLPGDPPAPTVSASEATAPPSDQEASASAPAPEAPVKSPRTGSVDAPAHDAHSADAPECGENGGTVPAAPTVAALIRELELCAQSVFTPGSFERGAGHGPDTVASAAPTACESSHRLERTGAPASSDRGAWRTSTAAGASASRPDSWSVSISAPRWRLTGSAVLLVGLAVVSALLVYDRQRSTDDAEPPVTESSGRIGPPMAAPNPARSPRAIGQAQPSVTESPVVASEITQMPAATPNAAVDAAGAGSTAQPNLDMFGLEQAGSPASLAGGGSQTSPEAASAPVSRNRPTSASGSDPFQPAAPSDTAAPAPAGAAQSVSARFHLEGVMLGSATQLAIVNGSVVEVGQTVDGAIVRAITDGGIAIEVDGRIYRIPLSITGSASKRGASGSTDDTSN